MEEKEKEKNIKSRKISGQWKRRKRRKIFGEEDEKKTMMMDKWTNKQNFLLYSQPLLWKGSWKNCRALMHLDIYIFVHRFAHNATSEGWLCISVWHLDMSLLCQHCTNMNTILWRNIHIFKDLKNNDIVHVTWLMFGGLGYVLFCLVFLLDNRFILIPHSDTPGKENDPVGGSFVALNLLQLSTLKSQPNEHFLEQRAIKLTSRSFSGCPVIAIPQL